MRYKLILASGSPRRLELLRQIGIEPAKIVTTAIDETPLPEELPRLLALRLAQAKAAAVPPEAGSFILGADTVVACGRRILPKTETAAEITACLHLLSGRRHRVYTGVSIIAPDGRQRMRVICSTVGFKRLSDVEVRTYLDSGEGIGKAGGYAIQGLAAAFIPFLSGSYSNVVGLPLYEVSQLLQGLGFKQDGA